MQAIPQYRNSSWKIEPSLYCWCAWMTLLLTHIRNRIYLLLYLLR
jgi:hypothetical protein